MLHMLRAGLGNQAEQCTLGVFLARYLLIMKILKIGFCFALLALLGARALAQHASESARVTAPAAHPRTVEPQKASAQKDVRPEIRPKRGTDLRLALMPMNSNSSSNANGKAQGGLANVADISGPESLPEHHLNVKERQEMRELLRQQRLKQQQN